MITSSGFQLRSSLRASICGLETMTGSKAGHEMSAWAPCEPRVCRPARDPASPRPFMKSHPFCYSDLFGYEDPPYYYVLDTVSFNYCSL
jgi:hypothetical protein